MLCVKRLTFGLMFLLAGAGVGVAQNFGISEFRAGILAHSVDEPGPGGVGPNSVVLNLSRIQDVGFDILFTSPDLDVFRWIGSPRPRVGATLNFGGLESMARFGLTWQVPLWDSAFFVEGTFGGAVHNGAFTGAVYPARNLGCMFQFYEAAGLGMNVSDTVNVVLELEHVSTADLCTPNRGLTNLGVKVGFKF